MAAAIIAGLPTVAPSGNIVSISGAVRRISRSSPRRHHDERVTARRGAPKMDDVIPPHQRKPIT